jgi:hypothetical protein
MSEVEPGNKLWPYHTHYLTHKLIHGDGRRGARTIQRGRSAAFLVRLSCDEPRNQERQRDGRREDENNAKEEDDHRPPRERRIVVADRREEAPDGVSQAEAPSVGGRLRKGHPLGGVWSCNVR